MRARWLLVLLLAGCAAAPPAEAPPAAATRPAEEDVLRARRTAEWTVARPPPLRAALAHLLWRRVAASPGMRAVCAEAARGQPLGDDARRLLEALAAVERPPPPVTAPADEQGVAALVGASPAGPLEASLHALRLLAWCDGPDAATRGSGLATLGLGRVEGARAALAQLERALPALGAPDPAAHRRVETPGGERGLVVRETPQGPLVFDDGGEVGLWAPDLVRAEPDALAEALRAPVARPVERRRALAAWLCARLDERPLALALLLAGEPAASARACLDDLAAARAAELVRDWRAGATADEVRRRARPLLEHAAGPDLLVTQELLRGLDAIDQEGAGWRAPTWAEWSELGLEERQAALAGAARAGAFDDPLPPDAPAGPTGRPPTTRERLLELGWSGIPTLIDLLEAPQPLAKDPSGWASRGDTFVPTVGSVCAELLRARGLGGLWPEPREKARAWWARWGPAGPGAWWTETLREVDALEFAELAPAARRDAPWVARAALRARLEAAADERDRAAWLVLGLGDPPDVAAVYDLADADDRLALVRLGAALAEATPLREGARSHLGRTLRGVIAGALAGRPAEDGLDFTATATAALASDVAAWKDDPRRRRPLVATTLRLGPTAAARLAGAGADLRPDLVAALGDPARAPEALDLVASAGLWARRWVEEGAELPGLEAARGALDGVLTEALPVTALEVDPSLPGPLRDAASAWGEARALDGTSFVRAVRAWASSPDGPPGLVLEVARDGPESTVRLAPGPGGAPGLAFEVRSGLFGRRWSRTAAGAPAAAAGHLFPELAAPFLVAHAEAVRLFVRLSR